MQTRGGDGCARGVRGIGHSFRGRFLLHVLQLLLQACEFGLAIALDNAHPRTTPLGSHIISHLALQMIQMS